MILFIPLFIRNLLHFTKPFKCDPTKNPWPFGPGSWKLQYYRIFLLSFSLYCSYKLTYLGRTLYDTSPTDMWGFLIMWATWFLPVFAVVLCVSIILMTNFMRNKKNQITQTILKDPKIKKKFINMVT